ncbi:MAG: 5-formyltetrahydrofolate cyclo-ligase [Deltaproteobacteria bacterium]|nr:MAG: 5-formyltetrahydrofolate cyclo-ligase [Deltaproteobacteria bacterium]
MPKRPIREKFLAARRHCSAETCLGLSLLIQERFLGSAPYRQAGVVGLYSPVLNEVQTEQVARQCLADAKRLVYPRVSGEALRFMEVSSLAELVPGRFGILEPPEGREVPMREVDLLVVPGVAFDLVGHRLGYGKGYYDRALAASRADLERVGFAYEFQVVAQLPAAGHDRRLTGLVTEQRMLRF